MTQNEKSFNYQVLNNLRAAFQGKYAEVAILNQLRDDIELKDEIEYTQLVIQSLNNWNNNLKKGVLIYGRDVNEVDLKASKSCEELLHFLSNELEEKGLLIKKLNASQEPFRTYNEVAELIAHFGRYIYTVGALLNQQKEYLTTVEKVKDTKLIDNQIKEHSQLEINLNEFIEAIATLDEQGRNFYDLLKFHTRLISGFYRAQIHELKILLAGPASYFSFSQGDFYKVEGKAWEKENFSASEAGYWRAYEISPTDAIKCLEIGLSQPNLAASWLTCGFTPETAKAWLDVWFNPILAITWNNSGYSPREAAVFVKKGIYHPNSIPQDYEEANRIMSEGLSELSAEMKDLKDKSRKTRRRNDIL